MHTQPRIIVLAWTNLGGVVGLGGWARIGDGYGVAERMVKKTPN